RAGVVFGTPGFMAPEQLRGSPPDERCDVYALGATMYHLLARRPPHYSKNAADMMRAAVDGPAEPLRFRAPGVPPELATIVDKALAFERDERYRSARELADDLQRFIGGQLVASHHYSQREKLARWVRNNRTTVSVATAALVAMVAGGTFAVSRIVAARDREHAAAEKAREQTKLAEAAGEKANANLQALQLADARNLTLEDPTRSLAMVKPLVPTRWREARDVAAAARSNGVAFSLPASPHAVSLELSRDGQRALEAGDDGIVRLYDLAKRTSVVIADAKTPTPAHFGDAEHTVVLFRDNHITLVDVATKARRDVMTPTAIMRLEVAGPIAYWIDPQHALWKLDLAGGQASKVATDEPIDGVFPSPDGRWVALGGSQHVFLIDRTAATAPPQPITIVSNIHVLQWSADALHAVMITDDEFVDIKVDDMPHVDHRYSVGRLRSVAWSRRGTYATGALGVELLHRDNDDHGVRVQAADCTLGLFATWDDAIVAGRPTKLSIVSDDGDRTIDSPMRLEKIAASPHGPFIAGASDGALLVWDLDFVMPHHIGETAPTGAGFVTSDAVIASYDNAPAQWIDLRTNTPVALDALQPIVSVAGSPDGERAFVIDVTHHGRIVAPVGDPVEVDADVDRAEFADSHHLVLATSQGAVVVAEPSQPRAARTLVKRDAQIVALATSAADGGWIAAAFSDHALWRAQLDGNAAAQQQLKLPPGTHTLVLGRDGEIVVASGPELRVWRADGTLDTLWTSPHSIHELAYVDSLHVLAIASDGKATIVDTREPNHVQPIAVEIAAPSLAHDASLAAMVTTSGSIELADPLASDHWQIAPRGRGMTGVQISPDGRRVIAISDNHLFAWTPALPDGVDATTRWLDGLTNAAIDRGPTAALEWKMLKPATP
ncbi:MAG TPA: protein kinase family protein, partial [Kofleriaceae bacterium]